MMNHLVLLPGMHGTSELFPEFMNAMPEPKHIEPLCYAVGASPTYDQLLAIVQSFAPAAGAYVLLAESYSTPLAIRFASTNPPNLRGLILCAGFATSPVRGWGKLLAALIAPLAFRLPLPKAALAHFLLGKQAPESLHASVRAAIRSVEPAVFAARLLQTLKADVRAELAKVAVPILYIRAGQDRLVPTSCLEEIQRIKPQTEVVKIDGPHLILQREPRRAAEAVARFLQRLA